jgi:hypothetical protein
LQAASASFSVILGGANCSATVTAREVLYTRRLLSSYVELDFSLTVTSGLEESNVQSIVKDSLTDGDFLVILSNKTGLALTAAPVRDSSAPSASPLRYSSSSSSSTLGIISYINMIIYTYFNMYTACVHTTTILCMQPHTDSSPAIQTHALICIFHYPATDNL